MESRQGEEGRGGERRRGEGGELTHAMLTAVSKKRCCTGKYICVCVCVYR